MWMLTGVCPAAISTGVGSAGVKGEVKNAHAEIAFSPEDDIAGQIENRIDLARRQVLVQAFSFTHHGIAQALIDAHRRGVEVRVIADREQSEKVERGQLSRLAVAGVPVWLDSEHHSAHNKIIVIDGISVITGSFNFTRAAQFHNAENVVFLSASPEIVMEYVRNWKRHLLHSKALTLH